MSRLMTKSLPLALVALCCVASVNAQGITRSSDAYQAPLPIAPAAAPRAAAPMPEAGPANAFKTWSIESTDLRLADTFSRWAKQAGLQFRWDAPRHTELGASNTYTGSVFNAMEQVLASDSIQAGEMPLEVCFYPNNPVLARVTRRGEQINECPSLQAPGWAQ